MSAERTLETAWLAYLKSKTALTNITTSTGIKRERDYSTLVTYPLILIRSDTASAPEGMYERSGYFELRFTITCETYQDEDLSGAALDALYDAVRTVLETMSTDDIQTQSGGALVIYEIKIMPFEGYFGVSGEVRQREIVLRHKVQTVTVSSSSGSSSSSS